MPGFVGKFLPVNLKVDIGGRPHSDTFLHVKEAQALVGRLPAHVQTPADLVGFIV